MRYKQVMTGGSWMDSGVQVRVGWGRCMLCVPPVVANVFGWLVVFDCQLTIVTGGITHSQRNCGYSYFLALSLIGLTVLRYVPPHVVSPSGKFRELRGVHAFVRSDMITCTQGSLVTPDYKDVVGCGSRNCRDVPNSFFQNG